MGGFRDRVKALTDGRGADVIYDPVGGDVFDESMRCVAIDGRILVWSKGDLLQKEKVGDKTTAASAYGVQSGPLYCLAWDARRQNLVAGANGHLWVYTVVADSLVAHGAYLGSTGSEPLKLMNCGCFVVKNTSRIPDDGPVRWLVSTDDSDYAIKAIKDTKSLMKEGDTLEVKDLQLAIGAMCCTWAHPPPGSQGLGMQTRPGVLSF